MCNQSNYIMSKFSLHILCLTILLIPAKVSAQNLPALGRAPEITVGTLPNGISYYVVSNPSHRGLADYALVQKGTPDPSVSRKALISLPHLGTRAPYKFVSSYGSSCNREGYISYTDESTRFDFPDMPVYDRAVSDTTLMMLFDIASTSKGEQAIIISGDVTESSLIERMKMYSLLVEPRDSAPDSSSYVWNQKDSLVLRNVVTDSDNVAAINLIFSSGRTGKENLNTPIPLITRMYYKELGIIVNARLERNFNEAGIPLLRTSCRYQDSSRGPEDERYRISVCVPLENVDAAAGIVAGTLSALDSLGAGLPEFTYARARANREVRRDVSSRPDNSFYVDKCASAYLYGSNLASAGMVADVMTRQSLPEDEELQLFNAFVSALLDPSRNLVLRFDLPEGRAVGELPERFNDGWLHPIAREFRSDASINVRPALKSKIKLKKDAPDPVTGGRLWTFSNGMTVLYKKLDTKGTFNYAVMLRGGYYDVPGLMKGEEVFVSEMFRMNRIGSDSWDEFLMTLENEGISMEAAVTASDLRVFGKASSSGVEKLLSSILSITEDRTMDSSLYDAFRRKEEYGKGLEKMCPREVNSLVDSLLCPSLSSRRNVSAIREGFPERVDSYFNLQFSKFSDGVFVFIGDLDEEELKKEILKVVGAFETRNVHSQRKVVEYPLYGGRSTLVSAPGRGIVGGAEIGVNIGMTAFYDYSMGNDMSFRIAMEFLRARLASVLADNGWSAAMEYERDLFPKGRVRLFLNAVPCYKDGVPAGVVPAAPEEMLSEMKAFLESIKTARISQAELRNARTALQDSMKSVETDPDMLMDVILARYSQGKDILSNYSNAISSVSEESVSGVINALIGGTVVEYVIEQ